MTDSTTESPTQPPTSLSPSRPNAFPSSQAHAEQASQDSSTHLDSDLHSLDALSPFSDQAMPYENDGVDQTHAEGGEPHKVDTTGNDAGHDFHNKRQGGRHHPNLDGNYSEEEEKNSTTKSDGDSHSSYNDVEDLTSLDWNELYQRFESEMQKKRDEEEQLHKRYQQLMEVRWKKKRFELIAYHRLV